MKVMSGLAIFGLACGLASNALADWPKACLLYPLWDDGWDALYAADYYDDDQSPDPCLQTPDPVYYWMNSQLAHAPEVCPNCQEVYYSATAEERSAFVAFQPKLNKVLPLGHRFHDTLRPIPAEKEIGSATAETWDPRPGVKVISSQWALVETTESPVPVKLYVIEIDVKNVSLPKDAQPFRRKFPLHRIGFEMESLPEGMSLPALKANRWNINPDCPTACLLNVDDEQAPYFVVTRTNVFDAPKRP